MNYLAHLYLADPDPESWIGNLMGDFMRGPLNEISRPGFRQGIWLHRKIDAFTDNHPLVRRDKTRICPKFRRYSGILIDIFYDHFLARSWTHYSSLSLREFSRRVYGVLGAHYQSLPSSMQRSVSYMISNDLLMSYRRIEGVGRALRGIEGRLKRESHLGEAVIELERHYDALQVGFESFFPEIIAYVKWEKSQGENSSGKSLPKIL